MALLDQVLISGTMFGMNLMLITLASPEAYGRFVLVFSLHLLAFATQNALILTPISVLLPGMNARNQRVTLRTLSTVDIGVVVFSSIIVALLVAAFQLSWEYWVGAMLMVIGASLRELHRTIFQTVQMNYQMVRLDGIAMAIAALLMFLLYEDIPPELAAIYALAGGNLMAVLLCAKSASRSPKRLLDMINHYQLYWKKSRWALLGAGLNEAQLRLYIFVIEISRGSAALGVLHAGRVLVNPVSLLAFSWGRASRPIMAAQFAASDTKAAFRTLISGTLSVSAIGGSYILCLHYFWPNIETLLKGGHGVKIGELLWLWSIFSLINLPSICISVYLQAAHRFRQLTLVLSVSVMTSSLLLIGMFSGIDISFAIWALIVGEIIMVLILITLVWRDYSGLEDEAGDFKPAL